MDCCNAKCTKHEACFKQGLEGNCCPNDQGEELACCSEALEPKAQQNATEDPKSCSAHPQCGNLTGDCCPNYQGVELWCCNATVEATEDAKSCSAHPLCVELSSGDCCPNDQGVMMDCCNAKCTKHEACFKQGLEGNCCPNDQGEELACCSEALERKTQQNATEDAKSCSAHPQCGELSGDCCPNDQGVMMDCCNAKCTKYEACFEQGLEGNCCPNDQGEELACCKEAVLFQTLVV